MLKMGLTTTAAGDCGREQQIRNNYILYHIPNYILTKKNKLSILNDDSNYWLLDVCSLTSSTAYLETTSHTKFQNIQTFFEIC